MKKYANALLVLCAIALIVTFISKSAHIRVNDFNAYYKTAVRAQHFETPYQTDGDEHPYKYPPIGIVLFFPFGFFTYAVSKIIYGLIELGCCFAIPFFILEDYSAIKEQAGFRRFQNRSLLELSRNTPFYGFRVSRESSRHLDGDVHFAGLLAFD